MDNVLVASSWKKTIDVMSQESIISYFWKLNIFFSLNLNLFGGRAKSVFPISMGM